MVAEKKGWRRNWTKQSNGAKYLNKDGKLPTNSSYTEWDVNKIPKPNRDSERFVKSSNGDVYYTNNHYETFIKIIN